jgi:formate-dependent nitrite reductase membrane component NrfD
MAQFNQYFEGAVTASLGALLILFGLPYLSSIPRVGKNTPRRQALLTLFHYFQFFLSCVLLGATITIRVLIYHENIDFNTAYIAAAIPAGALVALIGLLFFRLLMLAYGLYVGTLLGMLLEAGLDNLFDTQDDHQCTFSRSTFLAIAKGKAEENAE